MLNSAASINADTANTKGSAASVYVANTKGDGMGGSVRGRCRCVCAAVAAAPNTTAYVAKYGSGHYRPGDNEESFEDDSGEGEGTEGDYNDYNGYDKDIGGELGSLSSHEDIDDDDCVDI